MKIKDLAYFAALIKVKNFTTVAEQFKVSQPTISYAVKRLEAEFGTKLIYRDQSHQSLVITQSGEQLYQHATQILAEIELTRADMLNLNATDLRFGLPPIIGTYYFSKLAQKLASNGTIQHFKTVNGGSKELLASLEAGELDVALLGSATPLQTDTVTAKIIERHHFKIVVAPENPLAQKTAVAFHDLAKAKFIMLAEGFVHPVVFKNLSDINQIKPEIIYRTNDVSVLKSMVHENVGIGFLTETSITLADDLVVLDLLDEPQPIFYISLAYRRTHLFSQAQQILLENLEQAAHDYRLEHKK
ncbi:LysR family transcriptional regulator [Latilactobacillus graminis]|uniref:Bacterial regulatory helix-turn-helix, lysR family protein n=2 Tax=Latilactobacillus graminis TaxID=60519 RepID=A0AA89I016_9LACO|nr:LysR family transcriptional regulator [Latilactobacillus graminis]KRM21389.1 bacterial regulatory helix-turn-helix, lysR family protein [Latilactobacillus graminis DSM 20719]QFP80005.1 LysR family transcriptional regulator [Latilactobacillus graminis]